MYVSHDYLLINYFYHVHVRLLRQMRSGIITLGLHAPSISWCDVTGSKLFSQFVVHVQLFVVAEAPGDVGLLVQTQAILPNLMCRDYIVICTLRYSPVT